MQNFANPGFILVAGLGLFGLSACGLNSRVKVTTSAGVCSAGSIEAGCAAESSTLLSLTGRRPLAIKSGDTVTLTGTGFNKAMTATIGGIPVTSLDVTSATSASLVVPPGVATGMSDLKLALTAAEATASVAYSPADGIPLMTVAASEVCSGVEFYDLNGDKQTGTKSCSGSSSIPECTANRVVGCVTTDTYQSANLTNLSAGNIKSGITIAGQLGDYPSVTYKLPRAEGATADLADLDNATFDIKVKSATAFEYWTSSGSYQTGAGDANITQANIKDTVSIFGTEGNLTAAVAPDPWDLRAGTTVGGVTGKLKVNCRNAVTLSRFDNTTSPAAAGSDIWDTIDDYYGLPAFTDFPSSWSVANYCGGVDDPNLSSDDDNVWKDVTTAGTGGASCADNPTGSPERCTMQDKISGLKWSKLASPAAVWQDAVTTCVDLTHNGQTAGSWRLPTQKELMDAFNHGISSAARTDAHWMTILDMQSVFWSSSSSALTTSNAWNVVLAHGDAYISGKNSGLAVVCVQ